MNREQIKEFITRTCGADIAAALATARAEGKAEGVREGLLAGLREAETMVSEHENGDGVDPVSALPALIAFAEREASNG